MKKVLMSILLVCLTLCLLVGCSDEHDEPTPTPTTKTISVKKDNTEVFTFDISTIPTTTWGEVIGSGLVKDVWTLSVNEKNGRLVLTNTSTPTDIYYVSKELGEEFIKSSDIIGDTTIIHVVNPDDYTLKEKNTWFSSFSGTTTDKTKIEKIIFGKNIPQGKNEEDGINLTDETDGKVKGYIVNSDTQDMYVIYIVGDYIFGNENCSQMFDNFSGLTSIDFDSFDTSSVTDMSYMFNSCEGLKSLDLSKFDTSSVTDMGNMFSSCHGLTSLDLSKFVTSKVTNMSYMFNSCSVLTSLDLSKFDTSSVTDMTSMFQGCSGLKTLDLSNFDTSNVTDMNVMFSSCEKLETVKMLNEDTKIKEQFPDHSEDSPQKSWEYMSDGYYLNEFQP